MTPLNKFGSIYEATIIVKFTTGCTGNSVESAASNAALVLVNELSRTGITNANSPDGGLFKADLISSTAEDLRARRDA